MLKKLSFITTQKALIFNQFYSTFLEMASSILMVINGSYKDKFRATNSIPSLSANLSKPSSKLNSPIALFHILSAAAADKTVLDLQDMLQRFAFVNICKTAFGYDPEYLSPSLPQAEFARSFDDYVQTSAKRFREPLRIFWKIQRLLNIGSQKRLQVAICQVREFAENIIIEKKKELKSKISPDESMDLLSAFLSSLQYERQPCQRHSHQLYTCWPGHYICTSDMDLLVAVSKS